MPQTSGLTVRHFERESVELPVEFVIGEEHRQQVRFSTTSSAADQHVIRAWSTDISPGGLGLHAEQFLPRMCEGLLRVLAPADAAGDARLSGDTGALEGAVEKKAADVLFEHRAKVRRVAMRPGTQEYDIGVEFIAKEADLGQRIEALARAGASIDSCSSSRRFGPAEADHA